MKLEKLTDKELLNKTIELASKERLAKAELLVHLAEVDRRELYLSEGYSSMFDYLVRALKFSESAASKRIKAVRAISTNPEAIELLKTGELTLSSLFEASVAIKEDSNALERFKGVSARKAKLIASEYKPAPKKKIKDTIKPLGRRVEKEELPLFSTFDVERADINDLAKQSNQIKFQAGAEFVETLDEVKSLLSTKYPKGITLEEVFSECMEVYLDKYSPARKQARRKKRKLKVVKTSNSSRYIPAKTRDEVFIRDNHQCSYVSKDGNKCCSTHNLQVDHIKPYALEGSNEIDNLRLLCANHNRLEAKRFFPESYLKPKAA
ncbi:MAG: HNH endonuclease [Bdellovibrionales bacterium]|nr:HNH endonuclease [Bdellovibrionales bacterium]